MRSSFVLMLLMMLPPLSMAEGRVDFKIKSNGGPDLVSEIRTQQLVQEPTVQSRVPSLGERLSVSLGQISAKHMVIDSPGHSLRYDLSRPEPTLAFSYQKWPWTWRGQWGWEAEFAYSLQEDKSSMARTALHLVPITVGALYRGKLKETQVWAPVLGAGAGELVYLQRGAEGYNTSEARTVGMVSAGLWFGFGQWLKPGDLAPMDVSLTYRRLLSRSSETADWNSNWWFLSWGVNI